MNAHAITPHLQAAGAEFRACSDALDDAECRRQFLRHMYDSLPIDIIAYHCCAEDRLRLSPAYRALTPESRTVVEWALGLAVGRLPTHKGMEIADEHVSAAEDFLRQARDVVPTTDDVWETAENARSDVLWVMREREAEAEALAQYREDRYVRGTAAWLEDRADYDERGGMLRGME